jgi:hypothetical protein
MNKRNETVSQAVADAGGQGAVARHLDCKQPTVFKWTRNGLPRTEWTGETQYATGICELANANPDRSQEWVAEQLLVREGVPVARGVA